MGVDQGFDLFPPLTESEEDQAKWAAFFDEVKEKYENDDNVKISKDGDIEITLGEHPRLEKDGHRFRRFSSKVSGRLAGNVHLYLEEVEKIAKRHFGERIYPWDEYQDGGTDNMCYEWTEVYEAREWTKGGAVQTK